MRGANNKKHTTSATAPLYPKKYDTWLDTINTKLKYWTGTEWLVIL